MRVLLTGGAGYIGSHVVISLHQAGFEFVIYDNFSTSNKSDLINIERIIGRKLDVVNGDIRNKLLLKKTFRLFNIDAVIHLAGFKSVDESFIRVNEYYENNFYGTLQLINAMDDCKINKIIFSSSATVYGFPKKLPLEEDHDTNPTNPYGMIKLNIEQFLKFKSIKNPDFQSIILRYFNPVGAHESGFIGDKNKKPSNLMPAIVKVGTKEEKNLSIFGNDYNTIDGTCIRDYVHVMDLANGHVSSLNFFNKRKNTEIFNLGTGKGYSILEILKTFEEVNKISIPYKFVKRRQGDVPISFANVKKIYKSIGWTAKYSLKEMCKSAWNFSRVNNDQV